MRSAGGGEMRRANNWNKPPQRKTELAEHLAINVCLKRRRERRGAEEPIHREWRMLMRCKCIAWNFKGAVLRPHTAH